VVFKCFGEKGLKMMNSPNLPDLIIILTTLMAAVLIGNWFLEEVAESGKSGRPWYTPYLSIPGIVILVAISLPVLIWLLLL
jgi:hypothetical protein